MDEIFIGVIKNHEGKYFKNLSYYVGITWCENIKDAKIFTRLSTARTRVTTLVQYSKRKRLSLHIPIITQFVIGGYVDIDQTDRINQFYEKQRKAELATLKRNAELKQQRMLQEYNDLKIKISNIENKLNSSQNF